GKGMLISASVRDITERKNLERQVLEIASQEQRRIGQDLHDTVGQELTGLTLIAESLSEDGQQHPELGQKITDGLRRVLNQVRGLARGLIPVQVDAEGLRSSLQELAARVKDIHGVECSFEAHDSIMISDNYTATQLFHIAQEAVINAVKHGHPKKIAI